MHLPVSSKRCQNWTKRWLIAYVFGFSLHVFFGRMVGDLLFGGMDMGNYAFVLFIIQLCIACKIIEVLERLRVRIPSTHERMHGIYQILLDVTERAMGVSLGFAYLQQFKLLWSSLVFEEFGESYEADDATWQEVEDEPPEKEEEGHHLKPKQAWFGMLWLFIVLTCLIVSHAFTAANLRFQATSPLKKANKRLSNECISLAFGFATEKAIGTLLMVHLGSEMEATWFRVSLGGFVLCGLTIRHALAYERRQERRNERLTTITNFNGSTSLTTQAVLRSSERNNNDSSDSDDSDTERKCNDDEDSFELANTMTLTSNDSKSNPAVNPVRESSAAPDVTSSTPDVPTTPTLPPDMQT